MEKWWSRAKVKNFKFPTLKFCKSKGNLSGAGLYENRNLEGKYASNG